jgi:hypothetical protein
MPAARLKARLQRLERRVPARAGRCPACPPVAFVTEDADGNLIEGKYPEPCRTCGGPYGVSYVVVTSSYEELQAEGGPNPAI